jgi:hypothetical protein
MHIFYEKEESGELVHMGTCGPASFKKIEIHISEFQKNTRL